jgi:hypothetical protein
LSRRELTIAAVAIVGGGITFALIAARASHDRGGWRNVAPAARPSAAAGPRAREEGDSSLSTAARLLDCNQHHVAAFELPAENTVAI